MHGEKSDWIVANYGYVFTLIAYYDDEMGISHEEFEDLYNCKFEQPKLLWAFKWADWTDSGYWMNSAEVASVIRDEFDLDEDEEAVFKVSMDMYSGYPGRTHFDSFWRAMPCV